MHSGIRIERASPCSRCHTVSSVPERINSALPIRSLGKAVQMPLSRRHRTFESLVFSRAMVTVAATDSTKNLLLKISTTEDRMSTGRMTLELKLADLSIDILIEGLKDLKLMDIVYCFPNIKIVSVSCPAMESK